MDRTEKTILLMTILGLCLILWLSLMTTGCQTPYADYQNISTFNSTLLTFSTNACYSSLKHMQSKAGYHPKKQHFTHTQSSTSLIWWSVGVQKMRENI